MLRFLVKFKGRATQSRRALLVGSLKRLKNNRGRAKRHEFLARPANRGMLVTENQLDEWVRGNTREAQGLIVELIWRLTAASSPRPKERRFPLGDSIGQHGPDGILFVDFPFDPFVPDGRSLWEIGTGLRAGDKATSDYKDLVATIPEEVRRDSVFVFVTPLSGRRDWEHTWKGGAQAKWREERLSQGDWRDIRIIDGTKLIDWLHQFPAVELWLAEKLYLPVQQIDTPEQRWSVLKSIGEPPPLSPNIFLANRNSATAKLDEIFTGNAAQLKLDTHFPDQVVDFIAAYVAAMSEEARVDSVGRCVIISGPDAWNVMAGQRERHILVADSDLDLTGNAGTKMLEKALRGGHSVVYGGTPGGIPHPNCVSIPNPKSYQIKEILEQAGYGEEQARLLVQKSGSNLGSLLRCLQNLSLMPEWADGTAAADLAIAALLGAWDEGAEADRVVVENLAGKSFGEWIGRMRDALLRPGTPLTQREGVWKFVARYEGWYALGPALFDIHLDRLRSVAVDVLRERNPRFDLPAEERHAARVHGKALQHSGSLREGLAESLALLGSHPKALTHCSSGKAEATATLTVRDILGSADWIQWASLGNLLPLLAETAPREFLANIEKALNTEPCPFDELFAQETSGFMGATYISGVLWALETVAWDQEFLSQAIGCLGGLAARDPGGTWANRPARSLTTILLPWLPQTCAPIDNRIAAVKTLHNEFSDIGWKLVLSLLPQSHSSSSGSRKPTWREIIPADWSRRVPLTEYFEQIGRYAELAINAAIRDPRKLTELIDRLDDLPPPAFEQILVHLGSDAVTAMPEADRVELWTELLGLIAKHRKFADAEWAMSPEKVNRIAAVAEGLAPESHALRLKRLFSESHLDLYEQKGNYQEQFNELEQRRRHAAQELLTRGGVEALLLFVDSVQSPWRVGIALGSAPSIGVDKEILPKLLDEESGPRARFVGGFVWGRFQTQGWQWVDNTDASKWTPAETGQFLAYLPFTAETWERSGRLLEADGSSYWTKTSANPYEADGDLGSAVDRLIDHGRPYAAIRCLHKMLYDKQPLNRPRALRALTAALDSSESLHATDAYEITEMIKALQEDSGTSPEDLLRIEWAYLPILNQHNQAGPKTLERRLAEDPSFFCEVIRLVYRSRRDEAPAPADTPSDQMENIATNAYRLLNEWRTAPGWGPDGTYDGASLSSWLDAVKKECLATGHLEVAMITVGHVLIHAPGDPDGLWIHRSAAAALNARDATDVRSGFTTALFNSRGVFTFTAGQEERELAARYRTQATAVDAAGFQRLAGTLGDLAASYERDAERESTRDPFED